MYVSKINNWVTVINNWVAVILELNIIFLFISGLGEAGQSFLTLKYFLQSFKFKSQQLN